MNDRKAEKKTNIITGTSISLSNSISKENAEEEMSVFLENIGRDSKRPEYGGKEHKEPISNERIQKGNKLLGTYEVVSDVIEGGMGSVWRVHHMEWDSDLAMKRPQPHFFAEASGRRRKLFIEECENWIRLGQHQNIVACYYVREIGGVPTVFSEWMEGGSLKDRIKDGSLYKGEKWEVEERILSIAVQSARGLEYANSRKLVHQDVKPGNILLTKDWDAKVADFGLARARSRMHSTGDPADLKAPAAPKGSAALKVPAAPGGSAGYTLAYCPKEQAEGAPPATWMDSYSWALTVLEMYTGGRLWETGEEAKENCREYFEDLKDQGLAVPEEMQRIILSCLAGKETHFRFLVEDVDRLYGRTARKADLRPLFDSLRNTIGNMNNHALSFLDIGRPDLAENVWAKALLTSPNDAEITFNRGLCRMRAGKIDDRQLISELEELHRSTGEIVDEYIRDIRNGQAHYIIHRPNTVTELMEMNYRRTRLIRDAEDYLFQIEKNRLEKKEFDERADLRAGLACLDMARKIKGLAMDPELLDMNTSLGEKADRAGIRGMYPKLGAKFKRINWEALCFSQDAASFYISLYTGQGERISGLIKSFSIITKKEENRSEKGLFGDCLLSGQWILAASRGGIIRILDYFHLKEKYQFREEDCGLCPGKPGNEIIGLRIDRAAEVLAACHRNGTISVFDVHDPGKGVFLRNIYSGAEGTPVFDLSLDGKLLLTAGKDSAVLRVWDVCTGELVCSREIGRTGIDRAFFTDDPDKVMISIRHSLYLHDWKNGEETPVHAGADFLSLTPIADRRWFAAVNGFTKELVFFSARETGRSYIAGSLLPKTYCDEADGLVFSPNGRYLLAPRGDSDAEPDSALKRIRLWEIDWIFEA